MSEMNEKRKKGVIRIVGVGILFLLMIALILSSGVLVTSQEKGPSQKPQKKSLIHSTDMVIKPEESFRIRYKEHVKNHDKEISSLKEKMEELKAQLLESQNTPLMAPESKKEEMFTLEDIVGSQEGKVGDIIREQVGEKSKPQKIKTHHLNLVKPQSSPMVSVDSFVPAGSFSKIVLLSGVDASCAVTKTTDPRPVLMRLLDEGNLPRGFKSTLKECRILGAAQGDLSSERVYIRARTLTCIERKTGEVLEIPVEGYVTGGDGKIGIRGTVVSRAEEFLQYGFLSGFVSGLSNVLTPLSQAATSPMQALSQNYGSGPDSKDRLKMAAGEGAGNAMNRLSQYYIDRAEQVQPVIQVGAGLMGEIVFQKGFRIDHTMYQRKEAERGDMERSRTLKDDSRWDIPPQERQEIDRSEDDHVQA